MHTAFRSTASTAPGPSTRPTPLRTRLLWLDAVRAGALLVVVVGHILMAIVTVTPAGQTSLTNVLDVAAWSHWLTWPLQVMPVFFAVGAVVTTAKITSADPSPADNWSAWAGWMGRRARVLIVPATPLVVLWLLLSPVLAGTFGAAVVSAAAAAALVPLWFLAVYVLVQALVPLWLRLLRTWQPLTLGVGLVVLVAVVDALHLTGTPGVGYVNFMLVWSLPTLVGVLVHQRRISTRGLAGLAVIALAAAAVLVAVAGYELPVVGVTDSDRSNNSPPSLLLACHALAYASAVLAGGPRLERLLRRGHRRRRVLHLASTWSMPVYLWHMTGLVVLVAVGIAAEVPLLDGILALDPLSPAWWLARPVWLALCLAPTVLLIGLVRGPTMALAGWSAGRPVAGPPGVVVGLIGCSVGIGTIVENGIAPTPWAAVGLLALGIAALHPVIQKDRRGIGPST
ncbi:acyltransferase family protein [Euzebya tangerina]|uniref:acyltransferase family protein n=1 Tax=Euzebya tangerina TaxID=591198 RepID=UPI000E3189B5|nr:acyltransferase [Euzebya tangerina]